MIRSLLLKISILILVLVASVFSALRLYSIRQFSDLNLNSKKTSITKINSDKIIELEQNLEKVSSNPFASFEERSSAALKFAERAEAEEKPEKKIEYLCKTLETLSLALKKEPLKARTLVTWANVKQLLGSYKCKGDLSKGFEDALTLALKSDPLDQQALFNSALIFLWSGNTERAFPLFHRVLELGTDSSSFQREFIYSLAKDSTSLNALVPAKLPQAIEFLRYVLSHSGVKQDSLIPRQALWDFQTIAIQEFAARYEHGTIDLELYLARLLDIWKLSKESAVTGLLDKLLADYYSEHGSKDVAAFFSSRSHFSELEIISGFKTSDSRPEKSALTYWGSSRDIPFDEFFASVGFYLPRQTTLRRIELHSNLRSDRSLSGILRVLQSDDNSSWEDVTGVCTLYQVALPGRWVVYIELPGSNKRFWKLHYASPAREHQFSGALSTMVRAFGVGALKG